MKPVISATLFLLSIPVFAGIYRHDVPLEKYTALANQKEFDCVGQVCIREYDFCRAGVGDEIFKYKSSCVLIHEQYILCAAHVFDYGKEMNVSDYRFKFNRGFYSAETIVFFREGEVTHDLVLIKLDRPVTHITPAIIGTDTNELYKQVTGVGYGSVRNGMQYNGIEHLDYKMAGHNIIDSIGGERYKRQPTLLMADFDHPERHDLNVCGSADPLDLEYITNGGDSGGGLFVEDEQGYRLVGITLGKKSSISTTTGHYGSVSKWLRVSLFADWIKEEMDE